MRKAFFKALENLMSKDKDVLLLTDDLGYSFIETVQEKYPKQVINCGIIEQSMTSIAAGLAMSGKKPYIYGTIPFVIMRNYEQLRDDICYQNLNVKIIGISHSGFLGFTHNLEDTEHEADLLKNLPNLLCFYPISSIDVKKAIEISYSSNSPFYIKI